ncbi:MAG: aminodeoxychorismate/anthranilate synthase component II [Propionibacteriaceae bacterium]|jgi:anthranilate synthase component 2|nr:aminodeoxychorismate/anthranilate synthase component II [Propionibacteriaceae bacterium]
MIALIDNYDSFTYNLYQMVGWIDPDIRVFRNDALSVAGLAALQPSHIILSPGPGYPADAGITPHVVWALGPTVPILGVCLGHQAICEAMGGVIIHAKSLVHGKASRITLDQADPLFAGLPGTITVGRYHSLAVDPASLPPALRATAWADDGEIQAVRHVTWPVAGVQFHPESILTPSGHQILRNFLRPLDH